MKLCTIYGCENFVEGNTELCASHGFEKRKAERQAKKVKVIMPVKKVSEKRDKEQKIYLKLRKDFLEFKSVCELKLPGCTVTATTVHHAAGRIGKNFLDVKTFQAACLHCHDLVHANLSAEERRNLEFLI